MTNTNLESLPPEMQARIAQIVEQAKANPMQSVGMTPEAAMVGQQPAPAPVQRPPSLMDHMIALRQEVSALSQQVHAQGQVVEAVGNAVGQMYQMFQETTAPTSYSANFQAQGQMSDDDY